MCFRTLFSFTGGCKLELRWAGYKLGFRRLYIFAVLITWYLYFGLGRLTSDARLLSIRGVLNSGCISVSELRELEESYSTGRIGEVDCNYSRTCNYYYYEDDYGATLGEFTCDQVDEFICGQVEVISILIGQLYYQDCKEDALPYQFKAVLGTIFGLTFGLAFEYAFGPEINLLVDCALFVCLFDYNGDIVYKEEEDYYYYYQDNYACDVEEGDVVYVREIVRFGVGLFLLNNQCKICSDSGDGSGNIFLGVTHLHWLVMNDFDCDDDDDYYYVNHFSDQMIMSNQNLISDPDPLSGYGDGGRFTTELLEGEWDILFDSE
ncbi:MAG: hypothetical protein EZS28_008259 [Streblomastix strix]|uniref:Uncharacterized protein n=1 Tax=Streblomastix strix TaxID=222440 RepID=A0A5J4WMA9_9EUKA|nr:MAG: hypothetical protein EZS28_008259 [Streblomastix strix]